MEVTYPKTDILIYVEDPGAANFAANLPGAMAASGWRTRLLAGGYARDYLKQRSIEAENVPPHASADAILSATEPDMLVVGTSENQETLGLKLVVAARRRAIESIGMVDGFANAAYRFRGDRATPLAYAPDWLLVPDQWTSDAFIELGYRPDRIKVCGHPCYDQVRSRARELAQDNPQLLRQTMFPQAPDKAKIVVFLAEISEGLEPGQFRRTDEYTLKGKETSRYRTDIVLDEFLAATQVFAHRPFLVLRLHPKNIREEFSSYLHFFDQISQTEPPLDLVCAADLVVGMTSMLLLEAAIAGRPTLAVVPRPEEMAYLPSIRRGITPCATSREQLQTLLDKLLDGHIPVRSPEISEVLIFGATDNIEAFMSGRLEKKTLQRFKSGSDQL
jgi:hypothetical protein